MLAVNPVSPDTTIHYLSLQSVGDHSHVQRTDGGGLGDAVTLLGAAVLVVVGYVIGGIATSAPATSMGDAPLPVDFGGGAAKATPATGSPITFAPAGPVVGEFRLGPGNDPAPGIVRVAMPAPAAGEFRLGPGNDPAPGVVTR
jgi:hypothetical protein